MSAIERLGKKYGYDPTAVKPAASSAVNAGSAPVQPKVDSEESAISALGRKYGANIGASAGKKVDVDYINSFIGESQQLLKTAQASYNNLNWKTVNSNWRQDNIDYLDRSRRIRAYFNSSLNEFDEATTQDVLSYLDAFDQDYEMFSRAFQEEKEKANVMPGGALFYDRQKTETPLIEIATGQSRFAQADQWLADATAKAQQAAQWQREYGSMTYDQLQDKLYVMPKGTPEYEWLQSYAPTVMTTEDKKKQLGQIEAELMEMEAVLDEYNGLKNHDSTAGTWATIRKKEINERFGDPDTIKKHIEKLTKQKDQIAWSIEYDRYNALMGNADFSKKSTYIPQEYREGYTWQQLLFDNADQNGHGWEDPLYEFVNGIEEAGTYLSNQAANYYDDGSGGALARLYGRTTEDKREARQLYKDEVSIFNYLYATQGREKAHAYYNFLQSDLYKRQRADDAKENAAYATEHPVAASAFAVAISPLKGLSYVGQVSDYIDDGKLTDDAPYNTFSNTNSDIYKTVSDTIEQSGKWGKAGSFAYNTGMSMAEFVLTTVITGGNQYAALPIMGSGAAANMTIEAKERGLGDKQAFTLGTIAGVAEALSEKIGMDALFNTSTLGKSAFRYVLKNAMAEGAEEGLTTVINTIADIVVAKDESEWRKSIQNYTSIGYTKNEAFGKAIAEEAAKIGLDMAGGMLSGAFMAGGSAVGIGVDAAKKGRYLDSIGAVQDQETINAMIETGLASEKNSRAYHLANKLQEKLARGEQLTRYELGSLYQANIQAEAAETPKVEDAYMSPQEQIERNWSGQQDAQPAGSPAQQGAQIDVQNDSVQAQIERNMGIRKPAKVVGTQEQQAQMQRLSKLTGREVVLYEGEAYENGYYDKKTGKIYVNVNGADPMLQAFSHELTHSAEASAFYKDLSELVFTKMKQDGIDLEQRRQEIKSRHAERGNYLDSTGVDQEVVAYYIAENLLTNEQSITEFCREKPSLGRQILNWLDRFLAKLGSSKAQERVQLQQIRDLYAKALGQTQSSFNSETTAAATSTAAADSGAELAAQLDDDMTTEQMLDWLRQSYREGHITEEQFDAMLDDIMQQEDLENTAEPAEVKHSYAGRNALTANEFLLETAQKMLDEGIDSETIRQETGWFVGYDGKWRYEINDAEMQVIKNLTSPKFYKYIDGEALKLEDIIKHDALFDAYPELRNMTVCLKRSLGKNVVGSYDSQSDTLSISASIYLTDDMIKEVLIHEIQHKIQNIEGFARGSSPGYWETKGIGEADYERFVANSEREKAKILKGLTSEERENYLRYVETDRQIKAALDAVDMEEIMRGDDSDAIEALNSVDAIEAENDALYNKLYSKDWFIKLQEIESILEEGVSEKLYTVFYKNTAGEIEARDVSKRVNYTDEQRKSTRPDIDRANVTFSNFGESLYYIGDTKDGRRCYQSSFDSSVSMDERIKAFKERIATIFNLGAVELKTDVKKIKILGDRFTMKKNLKGDWYIKDGEMEAKISALYDLADILATSKYDPTATNIEESFANPSLKPKNLAHKGVKYWYKFRNEIVFDGVPYTVTFNIRDKGKKQYQYLIEVKENKTPGLNNTAVNNLMPTDQASYIPKLTQDTQTVKRQFSFSDSVPKRNVVSDLKDILRRGGDVSELRQYVAQMERNTPSAEHSGGFADQTTQEAEQIVQAAHDQGVSVDEYLRWNWEQYEYDGELNDAARKALAIEKGNSVIGDTDYGVDLGETGTDTRGEVQYSLANDSKYADKAIALNQKSNAVPDDVMAEAKNVRARIANQMHRIKDKGLVALPEDIEGNTFFSNSSYGGSEENTSICPRSLAAEAFVDAVSEYLGRPLTVAEQLFVSQDLQGRSLTPECTYCYVATDRKAYRAFLGNYIEQRDAVIDRISDDPGADVSRNGEIYKEFLAGRKDTKQMYARFKLWVDTYRSGKPMVDASHLTNMNRLMGDIQSEFGADLKPQIVDAMKYAQSASWAKKRVNYIAYNGHILNWKNDRINKLNSHYGLRMYSFSDFHPAFVLENMQMITDASVRGLKMLGYTKDLDFAEIFAPSGMNINISTFGFEVGGKVYENNIIGAEWAKAQALRAQHPNVGITFVATNDNLVRWALEQDWIDVVIPYHLVRTGAEVAKHFGYTNYTNESSDTKDTGWKKGSDKNYIAPTEHNNDKAMYLEALKRNHLKPRFERFLHDPNYMKLVNECRQSASESKPVQPVFNEEAAMTALAKLEANGYYQPIGGSVERMYEIAGEVAERMTSGNDRQYSFSDNAPMSAETSEPEGLKLRAVDEDVQQAEETEAKPAEEADVQQIRDSLPTKAKDYLKRAERKLLKDMSGMLGAHRFADRSYLQEVVRGISDEYLRNGTISEESLESFFTQAYNQGVAVDAEFYNQYKDVKDYLRTISVTLAARDQADIADWPDFRKRTFGTLRIVNDGGLPVDVAYRELQSMAPGLFPDSIAHPADQLLHMYDVARSITKSEKSLQEYHGVDARVFRKWAKQDFASVIGDVARDLRTVKLYADEKAAADAAAAAKAPTTAEEAMEAYKELKAARRSYEKTIAKHLLSEHDEMQVGRLLKGEILLEHLDPDVDNVKGITAVYEAKQDYERLSAVLAEYKRHLRGELRKQADGYLETANEWKDKKVGILYSRETMRRNIQDIVKDPELASRINREYFESISVAEAEATKFKNWYRDKIRALNLSTKPAKGDLVSEAHAVQLLGEVQDNIRALENARGRIRQKEGKTLAEWREVVRKLWEENPSLDRDKIDSAVKEFRWIYDQLFQQMNEARVRNGYEPVNYRKGYFPHFQPGDSDGIIAQFGKALGISTDVQALPTTINGLTHTFKPGIQWFGNAQERLGFNTAYDAVEGFDKYIEGVASVIHQTDNIQKLRALATQVRYRTSDEGIRKQVDAVNENPRLTEEEKQVQIAGIYEHGKYTLANFVVELDEYTNLLANKKSKLDRTMEGLMGRRAYTIMKAWESRVGANMIAGNLSSALTNFIPLTQASAQLDRFSLLRGMWSALQSYRHDDGLVGMSSFLTNRRGSDPLVKNWAQKASEILSTPMELIDNFVSDSIVRAAYFQNLKRGLSEAEAMHQADIFAAGVIADRSKGAMPTLFESSNPIFKAFTQFQLEVNNQFSEVFKDIPRRFREKGLATLALVLLKYFLGAFLFDEVYEYFIGRRPALDPIDILNNTVGDLTGYELPNLLELGEGLITGDMPSFETERVGVGEAGKNLATSVLEELPFSAGLGLLGVELDGGRIPASSAVPDLSALWGAATNTEWSGKKRWKEAQDELNKLAYVLPPFGGNQVGKIWKGVKAYIQGGSYNVDAEGNDILQYPVYKDDPQDAFWNLVRSALMGKSSLPEAQEWVDSGFDSLSAKQTAVYQDLLDAGVNDRDAYNMLAELESVQKTDEASRADLQRNLVLESELPGEGKAIIFYGMIASEKDRELMDRLADVGADLGAVAEALMNIQNADDSSGKRDAIAAAILTDQEKAEIYRAKVSDSRDDDIAAFDAAGLDFDDFLAVQNEYTRIGNEIDGAANKALAFSHWVNGQDYSIKQANTIKDCFTFYSQIPAEAARYDELVDFGMDPDDAYDLTGELNDLEPVAGADSVADIQKWRVCVDFSDNVDDQMTALYAVMSETQYQKVEIANNMGVTPDAYITLQEIKPKYDADGNGSYKNAEIKAAIDSMSGNYTDEQKAVLWQLATGSTSSRNNPYSRSIGQQVIDARAEAKKRAEEGEPTIGSFEDAITSQW